MSSDMSFHGAFKRFIKGDLDPINIFGLNPTRSEFKENKRERARRATQIAFEGKNPGKSTNPATKQIKKLRSKTAFRSLSPFAPPGTARVANMLNEIAGKKGLSFDAEKKLKKKNKAHALKVSPQQKTPGILGVRSLIGGR